MANSDFDRVFDALTGFCGRVVRGRKVEYVTLRLEPKGTCVLTVYYGCPEAGKGLDGLVRLLESDYPFDADEAVARVSGVQEALDVLEGRTSGEWRLLDELTPGKKGSG